MSLSDCGKCWDTPCTCGYEYSKWDLARLYSFLEMIKRVIEEKERDGNQA